MRKRRIPKRQESRRPPGRKNGGQEAPHGDIETKAAEKRRTPKKVDGRVDELRVRLIERLCRLPEAQLADVEAMLLSLERDAVGISLRSTTNTSTLHKDWPHAPVHRLAEQGTYIVTASTLHKEHFFRGQERLTLLEKMLLFLAEQHEVTLEAWAVFSNHYHFVAHTTGAENQLGKLIARLHYDSAEEINRRDGCAGRAVWFNFWDTKLTFEKSYLARLNYVHQNAVKHGLVVQANDYPWCSAAWFERTATPAQVRTIYGFKTDRVKIDDDYQPVVSLRDADEDQSGRTP